MSKSVIYRQSVKSSVCDPFTQYPPFQGFNISMSQIAPHTLRQSPLEPDEELSYTMLETVHAPVLYWKLRDFNDSPLGESSRHLESKQTCIAIKDL